MLRRIAAVLVGLEALALVAVAGWTGFEAATREDAGGMSVAIAALALGAGALLGWASRSLWRAKAWPRGLVLTWQVLQCAAGVTMLEWSISVGAGAIVVGVAAGAAVIADARREAARSVSGEPADE